MPEEENGQEQNGQEETYEGPPEEPQEPEGAIPRSALPEELRGLPPEQIGSATQALVATLRSRNEEVQSLREMMTSQGRESQQRQEPQEPEVEEISDEEFKDLVLEDPEKAFDHYLVKKGYAQHLQKIEEMASEGVQMGSYARAAEELPEFNRFQGHVEEILEQGGAAPTYANIRGAYLMARGAASLDEENKTRGRKVTSEKPSPPEPKEEESELSSGEEEARKALGLSKEDYLRGKERVEVTPPGVE